VDVEYRICLNRLYELEKVTVTMRDAYIVTSVRTPGCRQKKGAFKDTRPEDLLSFILDAAVKKTPGLDKQDVDDVIVGCCFPEAEQGLNIGRIAAQMAGFPYTVSGVTVNRFCASGLEAVSMASFRIMSGWADVVVAAGVESMSHVPIGGNFYRPHPEFALNFPDHYVAMGITAENVAKRYNISRQDQDEFAYQSHMKAAGATAQGAFTEMIPTPAATYGLSGEGIYRKTIHIQDRDDGIRPDTDLATLASLKPVFSKTGSVTAGNSCQMTDGAAATILMSERKIRELDINPLAAFRLYTTVGCRPDEMGVGPRYAIPKLLDLAGMKLSDIGLFEINEAFACQVLYCMRELGIDREKLNIHGGAIALGHPLGCTGAKLCATLVANMQKTAVRYAVESMCVGGGMGAAALFENCRV
jgi:acetyl-CoA acyltransferase